MKKAFRLILAAALCGLAFSSCSQDINVDDPVLSSAKGTRIINATFASATKTYLGEDGLTPYFENGDEVVVYNDDEAEKCTISVSGDKAWFSTNLEGVLTALYPGSQVILTDGQITGYKDLLSNQSGLFKDANICEATISEGSSTATFSNITALFKVTPPEGTKQLTVTYYGIEDIKAITTVGDGKEALGTYYVWLPSDRNLSDISFETTDKVKIPQTSEVVKTAAGKMYTITNENWLPKGALPGVFSVSATKQIQFSKGNLIATIDATGTPTAWKFAANQYDYLGEGGANKTIGNAVGDVDLFGWSTASTTYGISTSTTSSSYSGDFVDWGKNMGDGNTWRTLSKDEWVYLFETRTNASGLYKKGVTVCETNCVIIAPDNWDTSANPLQTSYDATAWATAETAGLVCLPAAGSRSGSDVSYVGVYGYSWSSTAYDGDSAYYVGFNSDYVDPYYDGRNYGSSVRLITESK